MKFRHGTDEFDLEFFRDDYLSKIIHQKRDFYESDLLQYMRAMNLRRGVAVDVGANIGNHAIYFERFLADLTIAVEANPQLISVLERNLRRNGRGAHVVVAKGLAARTGSGSLVFPSGIDQNIGVASFVLGGGELDSTTLDEITIGHDVSFVKIDVEGGELEVLKGGTRLLSGQHPDLFIETLTPGDFSAINEFLTVFGYQPISVWCLTPTWHFSHRPSLRKRLRAWLLATQHRYRTRLRRLAAKLIRGSKGSNQS